MENELTNASNDDQASVTQKLVNGSSYQHQAYTSISPAVVTTALTTKSAVSSSPFRSLPNIQPKNSESAIPPRQLIPKADGTSAQGAGAVQPNNVLIPQGIQHVLINGQLYPIIQTANGTHLLIQQPVGQVQHSTAKQVFTAQPVQLGGMAPSQSTQVLTAGNHMQISNSQSLPATEQTNDSVSNADSNIHTTAGNLGLAPIMPISSTGINTMTSTSSSHFLPTSQTPTNSFHMQPVASSQSNTLNNSRRSTNSGSVVVSPQAQQLLAKIQHQLQLFKRKPVLDEEAKKAYAQLQQAEHQVLNNIQSQLQAHRAGQDAGQMGQPANQGAAVGFGAVGPPGQPPPPQASLSAQHSLLLQHGVTPSSANKSELIIKPVPEGASPLTQENIMAIMNAFANVKVGTQIYNIQLTDGQKKSFIEAMSTMTAQSQHSFLLQQQTEILLTVFKNQQQQQELIQQQFQQQNQLAVQSQQNFIPQFQQPQTPASSQLSSKPNSRSRSKKRPATKSKSSSNSIGELPKVPVLPPMPLVPDPPSPNISKLKPAAKKARHPANMSTKKISEKMLQQIMKDQEIVLKPGGHKKAFANANQVRERLLRFHLFYTAEPYKAYRKLQEEQLYRTTAHETVLCKERLINRFRFMLWKDSIDLKVAGEDKLIADLLKQDEEEAMEQDHELELCDIEKFKALYCQPAKDPTPPPSPELQLSDAHILPTISSLSDEKPSELQESSYETEVEPEEKTQAKKLSKAKGGSYPLSPESDIIRHLKRETAREAREQRAAKRGSVPGKVSAQDLPLAVTKRNKRGRPPMIKTLYPPDSNSESSEYTDSTKPSNNIESSLLSSGHEKPTSTDQNSHSNTDTLPLVSDDQQVCRSASSLSGSSSKRNSSAEDTSSSSSSEDELIDIVGSPPTPPSSNHQLASMTLALPVSSAVHNLSNKPRSTSPDVASHSSYVDSYTSTPKKGFSICTETVFEQSEQPDNSFEHHNSTFSQNDYERSNSFNESLAPPNIAVPPSINYQTQYSEENNLHPDNGRSDYQDNNQWHPSNYNSYSNENEHIRSESAVSQQLSVSEASGTLPEPSDDLEYDNSTDDGDTNDIEGGVPVAWEDNTRNVLSEAEDSRESIEDGHDQTGNAHGALQKPIMPLRINKSKFGDYMWASDDSASSSPAPIRLKISEPVPPPIKLRIKRDRNDKWEAASSVSSYASDVNSVSGNDSNSEENESESLNWMVTEEAENSSSASASETEQQFEEDGEDDVPFSHYES